MKLCTSTTLLISQVLLALFLHEATGSFYLRFGRGMKKYASDARVMRARTLAEDETDLEQLPQISRIVETRRSHAIDVPNDEHILSEKRKK